MPEIRFDRAAIARTSLFVGVATLVTVLARERFKDLTAWTVDDLLLRVLLIAVGFAILFVFGVKELRRRSIRRSPYYAALGAASIMAPFLVANGWDFLAEAAAEGVLSIALSLPLLIGGLAGYLYHRSAGYETDNDNVDALAAKAESLFPANPNEQDSVASTATFGRKGEAPALLATDQAEYYAGPLQVRDSFGARIIAALCGASLYIFLQAMGMWGDNFQLPVREEFRNPVLLVGLGIVGLTIMYGAFIKLVASILRKFDKTSLGWFAFAGMLAPWIFGLPLGPAGWLMALSAFVPFGFAMTVFHILAGFEPKALPDDIQVSDRRTLVGADHVRRRMARVIDTSE